MFIAWTDLPWMLLRATLALSVAAAIAGGLLYWLKPESARLQRVVWLLVLLQAIVLLRVPVNIPWYEPPAQTTVAASFAANDFLLEADSFEPIESGPFLDHEPVMSMAVQRSEPAATINWQAVLIGGWLAGCGATVLWWAVVYVRVARRAASGEEPTAEWEEEWQGLCGRVSPRLDALSSNTMQASSLGETRPLDGQALSLGETQPLSTQPLHVRIPLKITNDTGPVLLWRGRGAVLLVPRGLWTTLSRNQRLAVLRHELAHYERGDLWKGALVRLLALPHWFNPAAWWVVKNLDECAEWLCDDAATGTDHGFAKQYAEVLLQVGQRSRNYGLAASGMRGGRLHRRICRVLEPAPSDKSLLKKLLLVAAPLVLLAGNAVRVELVARAQTIDSTPQKVAAADSDNKAPSDSAKKNEDLPDLGVRLNYLRPNGAVLATLFGRQAVQKELGVDAEQAAAYQKQFETALEELSKRLAQLYIDSTRANSYQEGVALRQAVWLDFNVKQDLEVARMLKPEQRNRLQQIAWQHAGADALRDPNVAKALDLSAAQRERLEAMAEHVMDRELEASDASEVEDRGGRFLKLELDDIDAERDKKSLEILSQQQREKFAELKGTPFDVSRIGLRFAVRPSAPEQLIKRAGGLLYLALTEPVLKDLGFADDSPAVASMRKLQETYRNELSNYPRNDQWPRRLLPQYEGQLKKVLTAERYTRLRQIELQRLGLAAFDDAEVRKALALQPDQEAKIFELKYATYRTQIAILRPLAERGAYDPEATKKVAELNAEWKEKLNEILTKEQQEKFAELKGKTFDVALLSPQVGTGAGETQPPAQPAKGAAADLPPAEPAQPAPANVAKETAKKPEPTKASQNLPLRPNYLLPNGVGLSGLFVIPAVQKELGVDAEKIAAYRKIEQAGTDALQAKLTELFKEGKRTPEATRAVFDELAASRNEQLKQLITPEQYKRLQQIAWQHAGADALRDPTLVKALELTPAQQEKLATLAAAVEEQQRNLFFPKEGKRPEAEVIHTKLREINTERDAKAVAMLSKQQQDKFAELKGKSFDMALLPSQYATPRPTNGRPRMPISIRGGGLMDVALSPAVLKELGIAEDAPVVAELRKLQEMHRKELSESRPTEPDPEDRVRHFRTKYNAELQKVFTPEQYTRLRQIDWQQMGPSALDDLELQKALGVSAEQEEKIFALKYEIFRKQTRVLNANDGKGPPDPEAHEKVAELHEEWKQKLDELLTKEQREKLAELKGKAFDVAGLRGS